MTEAEKKAEIKRLQLLLATYQVKFFKILKG